MTLSNGKTSAYQWDIGLTVPTTDAEGTVRRFTNEHSARSIPVACAEDSDGNMVYAIPNILLTTGRPIIMFTLAGDNDGIIYTDTQEYLPVYPAPKPDDYIYTEAEINLWKSLCDRMDTAESNIATNTENIGTNAGNIASNTLAIGQNTLDIAANALAIGANTSDISAIKSAPHVYIFPFDDFTLTSTATFAEVTAAFQRGDIVKVFGWGYELRLVTGQYTEPPAEEIEMTFACEIPASDSGIFVSNAFLWAHLENGAWEFDTWLDTLPQWLAPDITDSSNYGKVPVITSLGVEWQMPSDDIPAPASPNDGDVLTYDSNAGEWIAAAPGGGGSSDIYLITLDAYDTPTNTISEIEDAIDAGKLLVAVNPESNGYGYVVMYKGEYDATSLDLYAHSVDPASGVSVTAWSKEYTYTYASQTWSITASNGNQYTLPSGGTTGQALVKNSNTVGDTKWANLIPAPASPNDGDVLTYDSNDGEWVAQAPSTGIPAPASPNDGDVLTYDSNDGEWVAQAPSGGSTDIFVIQLDNDYLPLCSASDVISAINGKQAIVLSREKFRASPLLDTSNNMVAFYAAYTASGVSILALQPTGNTDADTITATEYHWSHDGNSWSVTSTAVTVESVPAGGTTGQVLAKASNADYAASWTSLSASDVGAIALPSTPTTGQVLTWSGSAWVAQSLPVYDGS